MPSKRPKRPRQVYYHLSDARNMLTIREGGIVANGDGEIFLFTDMLVANVIAKSQVFVDRYVVFEVAPDGIQGELRDDNVAEFSHSFQRILKQDRIAPEHLQLVGEYETIHDRPTEWDYVLGERLGQSHEFVDEGFSAERDYREAIAEGVPDAKAAAQYNERMRQALEQMRRQHPGEG